MIDLHAHILPGIDDGPVSLAETLQLLRVMQNQGVTTVVAAAHALDGRYNASKEAVLQAVSQVNEALHIAGMTLQVLPSMELLLGFDTLRAVKAGQVLGLNQSRYLIVELPSREFPVYAERALFELMIAGYRPILNHPERNRGIQHDPEIMLRLAENGIYAMITAASLLGRFGARAQRLAECFLKEKAATLVVSDAHDLQGRLPLLPDGLQAAERFGKRDQSEEIALLA